jgi:glycosyltransferase involved in cell wall biosynthesis
MHLVILTQVLDRDDAVLGFFHGWCEVFARHVPRLTVVAQRVGATALPGHVALHSLGKEAGGGRLRMAQRLVRVLAGLRGSRRPDAVWVHMVPRLALYAAPALLPRRVPMFLWYTHKGVDASLRLAAPLVRRVFTASEESFRLGSARRRRVVTGHGIDCARFAPGGGPRDVDVLCVGRLSPSKGQVELLEALARCPGPPPRTVVAGDILLASDVPYRERVRELAARLGPRVELAGAVPWLAMPALMGRARVLANVSRTGSVDKVVLEAMACGALPLTCNESFAPLLGPGLAPRLMFRPGDAQALADGVQRLLALPAGEAGALSAQLREVVVRGHDLEDLVPRMLAEMEAAR